MVYNNLSGYLRDTYNEKVRKICIDGGFTCPNRDGKCGYGGCIFCSEQGSGEHINSALSIHKQVDRGFFWEKKARKFIAYFQNFTNTYAPIEVLKERYDEALYDSRIVIFSVGTRPDCIDEEVAKLLASYKAKGLDVWVELGLQTANDETAKIINRGYDREVFTKAVKLLNEYDLKVIPHIIIGLPGERQEDIGNTVDYINSLSIWGLKIHSIFIMEGTVLGDMYKKGLYTPPTRQNYIDWVIYALTHLNPHTVIHRITGNCEDKKLIAPDWNRDKDSLIIQVIKTMEENNLTQGCYYKK